MLSSSVLNDYATLSGVDYRYDVTAVDRSGNESAPSSLSSAVGYNGLANAIWPVPFVRATQEATPGATAVKWFASPTWDVASYRLQRKTSAQSSYTDVGTFTRFIYLDSGLTSGVTYNYRVVAIGNDGTASAPSMVATVQAP